MRPTPAVKTVLVVEDNEAAREGLASALRRAGYGLALASDGQEALDYLRSNPPPALVLLDMMMPVLDGWHFLQRLNEGDGPRPPIVVTTATVLTREWAADHGCAGFLRKPIDTADVLAEVRRCAGPPG